MTPSKRLWSLWDMQRLHVKIFLDMQDVLVQWAIIGRTHGGPKVVAASKASFSKSLREIIVEMQSPEFNMCRIAAQRFLDHIEAGVNDKQLIHDVDDLRGRILDQMGSIYFLTLSPGEKDYFDPPQPLFGQEFAAVFPSALFDLDEGAKCLAVGRYTSCVFHLMRIMEIGVQQLGQKVNITINPKDETWHQILLHVNKAINQLPIGTATEKKIKAEFAACSAHLGSVRIAWRNEVMHPKATYTEEEAKEIFAHVRTFMRELAKLLI